MAEVTISFVMSVCPSVLRLSLSLSASNNSAPTERIFMLFDMSIFLKSTDKIKDSLSDKNNGYIAWRLM